MADQHPTDDPALSQAARHTLHDEELVAAYAADPDESEGATRAKAMIDRCATCASIAADIAAITGAMRSLGRAEAVAATIRAPRDFRLTAKDAARLGPVPVAAAASTPTPAPSSTPAPLDTQTPAGAPEPVPAQLSMAFEADEAAAVP
ncbi:MAG TPA: hypothetical protein VNL94_01295, partial [Candidatus Binatia bacterium]|nr:hypothetical protein [Candidatus Binatia bacterium]